MVPTPLVETPSHHHCGLTKTSLVRCRGTRIALEPDHIVRGHENGILLRSLTFDQVMTMQCANRPFELASSPKFMALADRQVRPKRKPVASSRIQAMP
ncbi:hypothetical protein DICSQDRAFT_139441 [Dichomitus squalens LYAD-421 SS1]|uniref:Uncharacterized protein n=1 Tax=Dichomitus squalens (strain LYAD-421) TaxID=732165 RepID=R7SQI8_DICSQ|nr:uncharacterized protein DICSQDRAFT_139441 [Dichomitus squalens LYAD-421 SS1]EJF58356.1 hypothetical protein DICSQDRAFT_139441 [Dichomitus squalens LYAD-421 SS1]